MNSSSAGAALALSETPPAMCLFYRKREIVAEFNSFELILSLSG